MVIILSEGKRVVVTTYQYEKMTVYITLGRQKSEFPGMNEELSQAWDQLAAEIGQIQVSGGEIEVISESI